MHAIQGQMDRMKTTHKVWIRIAWGGLLLCYVFILRHKVRRKICSFYWENIDFMRSPQWRDGVVFIAVVGVGGVTGNGKHFRSFETLLHSTVAGASETDKIFQGYFGWCDGITGASILLTPLRLHKNTVDKKKENKLPFIVVVQFYFVCI